ncbi:MAG: bifunctional 5,10-methylenetetrahydrofolate dehydrogenase/5,10-methenyltetrahydrofolate cyclohydrolase [Patescibacteria group bacterium]|nr:bifunctional 5,10-methylenetetrahydrofolate dehydrogenase/5,10-methenyltetrahydrofolate cyclohydrolase [Patescibacteria group bacterium]
MNLINGKELALSIREGLKKDIASSDLHPKLGVMLVGEDAASNLYVNLKEKAAHEAGIETDIRRLPSTVSDEELVKIIQDWNSDEAVNGILVQLPLPPGHDTDTVTRAVLPRKDADGFHPKNIDALYAGEGFLVPPLLEGILRLIGQSEVIVNLAHTVIIANSEIFAKPLEYLLRKAGSFVQIMHPDEADEEILQAADIIIIAVGRARFLRRSMIKSGACIIDVGTNKDAAGKVVGDVDAENIRDIAGWLTPVPGGVGPMTIAMLLKAVFELAQKQKGD